MFSLTHTHTQAVGDKKAMEMQAVAVKDLQQASQVLSKAAAVEAAKEA
jgi:hypothetical protein